MQFEKWTVTFQKAIMKRKGQKEKWEKKMCEI
jgi:hypothetical protein